MNLYKVFYCNIAIFLVIIARQVTSQDASIIVSLKGLSPTEGNSEIHNFRYNLTSSNSLGVKLTDASPDINFIIFQVHSYLVDVTLSYSPSLNIKNHVNGTNLGLYADSKSALNFYIFNFYKEYNVDLYISVHAYSSQDPIPGGCNMEFNVENAPFLSMKEVSPIITVEAAPAGIVSNEQCDNFSMKIEHKFYHFYLNEDDKLNRDNYFKALKDMMVLSNILDNSHEISNEYSYFRMRRIFSHYANTPSIFVVTASYKNYTSVYVPVFSSGCSDPSTCETTSLMKYIYGIVAACGFIMCFFGHVFFKLTLFMFGALLGSVSMSILLMLLTNAAFQAMIFSSLTMGFISGILALYVWRSKGLPLVTTLAAQLCLGFHVASIIYYACPGSYWFQIHEDLFFWPFFASIVMAVILILMPLAHHANMKCCAVIGAFALILPLDVYFGSHLRYIFVNIIRRCTVLNFDQVHIDPPFQTRDLIVTQIWGILVIVGYFLQRKMNRGKPPFPPPNRSRNALLNTIVIPSAPRPDENTPLLTNYFWNPQQNGQHGIQR